MNRIAFNICCFVVPLVVLVCSTRLALAAPVDTGNTTMNASFVANATEAFLNSTVMQLSEILANASAAKPSTTASPIKPAHSSKSHSDANEWVQNKNGKWEWAGKATTKAPATQKFIPHIVMKNVTNSTGQVIGASPQIAIQPINQDGTAANQSFIPHLHLANVTSSTGDVVGVQLGTVLELFNGSPTMGTSTATTSSTSTTKASTTTPKPPPSGSTSTAVMSTIPIRTLTSNSSMSASVFDSATDLAGAHLKVGERLEVSAVLPESNTVVLRVRTDNNVTSNSTNVSTSSPVSSTTTTHFTRSSTATVQASGLTRDFLGEASNRSDDGEKAKGTTSTTSPKDGLSFAFSSVLFRQAVADAVGKEMEKFKASEAKRHEDERNEIAKSSSQKKGANNNNDEDDAGVITLVEKSRVAPAKTTSPSMTSTTITTTTTESPATTTAELKNPAIVFPPGASDKQKQYLLAQEAKKQKAEQTGTNLGSGAAPQPAVTFGSDTISYGLDSLFQGVMGLFNGGSSSESAPSVGSLFSALPFSFSGADTLRNAQQAAANYKPIKELHASFS